MLLLKVSIVDKDNLKIDVLPSAILKSFAELSYIAENNLLVDISQSTSISLNRKLVIRIDFNDVKYLKISKDLDKLKNLLSENTQISMDDIIIYINPNLSGIIH